MITRTPIFSNPASPFNVAHSGVGNVILELQHGSDTNVAISGTGQLTLLGRIQGNGQLSVSGTAQLNAITCPMKIVTIRVSGTGSASVYGVDGVYATVSGTGNICYRGPLLSQQISGSGSIKECILEHTTIESQYSSTENNKVMRRNPRFMVIFAVTIFFFFY